MVQYILLYRGQDWLQYSNSVQTPTISPGIAALSAVKEECHISKSKQTVLNKFLHYGAGEFPLRINHFPWWSQKTGFKA
ncbi:hypothetical protein M3651_07945 [Cytobacillus oceanisediminis]|nr:hypothetical protein [Cytobacillus oceanisediminis]